MNAFILELLNMSFVASLLILAVILVRLVFRKAPKAIICVLWALVGLRLICPFTLESPLSLVPDAEPVTYIARQASDDGEKTPQRKVVVEDNALSDSVIVKTQEVNTFDFVGFLTDALPFIWLGGVAVMAATSIVSYIRLRRQMLICVNKEDNIWLCDGIKSPFILGIVKPKIYVPSHLSEAERAVVIAHEKAHLKRLDHLWKPFGYVVLTVHWFNPLVWVAYALLCRDIEGACDERVVKKMSGEDKKLYSETLLSCSAPRHALTACPVAFGEVSVKGRVKSVLSYKKPAFWIIVAAVITVAAVAVLFMTNPVKAADFESAEELIHRVILDENANGNDNFLAESHYVFDTEDLGGNKTAYYLWVACNEYSCENGELTAEHSSVGPKVITVQEKTDGTFELSEYWESEDTDSIKEKFPSHLYNRVLYGTSQDCVSAEAEKAALEHFGITEDKGVVGEYPRFTGEILEVDSDGYLIAPAESDTVMGQQLDKVYVYREAGDAQYIKGDVVTVYYSDGIEDTDPPRIDAKSISLCSKVYSRIEPYTVKFYRKYTQESATLNAELELEGRNLNNIEVYRYTIETPSPPENVPEDGALVYYDNFASYFVLDYELGYFSLADSDYSAIVGFFEEDGEKLILQGASRSIWFTDDDSYTFIFTKTEDGYAFDAENSAPIVIDGKGYGHLPDGAVFKDGFNLEVTQ